MRVFEAALVEDDWKSVRSEMERAFRMSHEAATAEESFVYIVRHDDLLGRRGPGPAMLATGLLSAARTAAIEGSRKGWTANVVAYDDSTGIDAARTVAERLLNESLEVTGELIRVGSSHLGKALP